VSETETKLSATRAVGLWPAWRKLQLTNQ